MLPLHGVGVLVTRPEQQAQVLCHLLESAGASTLRLPAIDIKGIDATRTLAQQPGARDAFDVVIFTSVNAVRFGVSLLDRRPSTLAAIGPATARALNAAGYQVAVQPSGGFDSENLLIHPRLENMSGQRVLLIQGSNGRGLLEHELVRRGATVLTAEVYRREPATPTAAALAALLQSFAAGAVQVITATSLEIAVHLLELAAPPLRSAFDRAHWVLPGDRIAAGVRARGLLAPLLRADSAQAHDVVAAIVRWRSTASGE